VVTGGHGGGQKIGEALEDQGVRKNSIALSPETTGPQIRIERWNKKLSTGEDPTRKEGGGRESTKKRKIGRKKGSSGPLPTIKQKAPKFSRRQKAKTPHKSKD